MKMPSRRSSSVTRMLPQHCSAIRLAAAHTVSAGRALTRSGPERRRWRMARTGRPGMLLSLMRIVGPPVPSGWLSDRNCRAAGARRRPGAGLVIRAMSGFENVHLSLPGPVPVSGRGARSGSRAPPRGEFLARATAPCSPSHRPMMPCSEAGRWHGLGWPIPCTEGIRRKLFNYIEQYPPSIMISFIYKEVCQIGTCFIRMYSNAFLYAARRSIPTQVDLAQEPSLPICKR